MDTYKPLQEYLSKQKKLNEISLELSFIEKIIGHSLPKSAYKHTAWWSNTNSHSHSKTWLEEGWQVKNPSSINKTNKVVFVRKEGIINNAAKNKQQKKQLPYDTYERQYQFLTQAVLDNQDNYEKTILTLSASFLALSVSFLGLYNIESILRTVYLFICWGCFFTSVLFILLNFKFCEFSINMDIDHLAAMMKGHDDKYKNRWSTIVEILYILAGIAFIIGVIFLILFCGSQFNIIPGG